jgi:1-acyl-sn-glycerol-3-phosphate acyltransferase
MTEVRDFISFLIRAGTRAMCRIDLAPLKQVPKQGPLILVVNHINSLEVPLLFAHLQPRRMIGLAKIETWDNKFMGWLFDLWDAIPVKRGELDLDAAKKCLATLKEGTILGVAPEGTRSYNGSLQRGEPGIVLFALHSGAPILPIAHWGGERIGQNLKKLRRTDFHIRVGKPFKVSPGSEKMNGMIRQTISDEIMWQIAQLMPLEYRGEYVNYKPPATQHLVFI